MFLVDIVASKLTSPWVLWHDRSRDTCLMELAELRRVHERSMESVYNELVKFDDVMELYASNLVPADAHSDSDPMTSDPPYRRQAPKVRPVIAVDDVSAAPSMQSIDTSPCPLLAFKDVESTHRSMEVLLKKWTTVIKKLPSVRQNFKDVTAAVTAKHENKTKELMEIVAQQASRVKHLEQMVEKLRYAR